MISVIAGGPPMMIVAGGAAYLERLNRVDECEAHCSSGDASRPPPIANDD